MSVCRQCHKTCLNSNSNTTNGNCHNNSFNNNSLPNHTANRNLNNNAANKNDDGEDWQSLMLMGLSAININPAAHLVNMDPFSTPVPKISVVPPTPVTSIESAPESEFDNKDYSCNCKNNNTKPQVK